MICHKDMRHYKGDPKAGCVKLLTLVGVDSNEWTVGKTKVFLRSPESLFGMDDMRERAYNHYAGKIQRVWRRRTGDGRKRWREQVLFWDELITRFDGVWDDPYYGLYTEWPEYPTHLVPTVDWSYKIWRNWWAWMKIMSLTAAEEEVVREKLSSYNIFHGHKSWTCTRRYEHKYLGNAGHNEFAAVYSAGESLMLSTLGESRIEFSCLANKVNTHSSFDKRGLLVTDKNIYRLDPKKFTARKNPLPLSAITRISLSTVDDTFVVLHMRAPDRDLVIDVGIANENLLAEFVTVIYRLVTKATGTAPTVDFASSIRFNNRYVYCSVMLMC